MGSPFHAGERSGQRVLALAPGRWPERRACLPLAFSVPGPSPFLPASGA